MVARSCRLSHGGSFLCRRQRDRLQGLPLFSHLLATDPRSQTADDIITTAVGWTAGDITGPRELQHMLPVERGEAGSWGLQGQPLLFFWNPLDILPSSFLDESSTYNLDCRGIRIITKSRPAKGEKWNHSTPQYTERDTHSVQSVSTFLL